MPDSIFFLLRARLCIPAKMYRVHQERSAQRVGKIDGGAGFEERLEQRFAILLLQYGDQARDEIVRLAGIGLF